MAAKRFCAAFQNELGMSFMNEVGPSFSCRPLQNMFLAGHCLLIARAVTASLNARILEVMAIACVNAFV